MDRNEDVPVHLYPEPENIHDPKAICFKCKLNTHLVFSLYVVIS